MALSATLVWEVRADGAAANSGGFRAGAAGTDFTQQAAAQQSYTDLVIDAATNTNITSAARAFTSVDVGNTINITSGTGFTVQTVEIMSVLGGIATCDKSVGTLGSTGGTGKLGGAKAAPEDIDSLAVAGNTVYLRAGTYTKTSTRTLTLDGTLTGGEIGFIGYASGTRTDTDIASSAMPEFTTATDSTPIFSLNGVQRVRFRNIRCTNTATTKAAAWTTLTANSTGITWENCVVSSGTFGWFSGATVSFTQCHWERCTATGCVTAGWNWGTATSPSILSDCLSYSNTGDGFKIDIGACNIHFDNCISYGNGGHGWNETTTTTNGASSMTFDNCVGYGNTGSGWYFAFTTGGHRNMEFNNCVAYGNGAYGVACATAGLMDGKYPRIRRLATGANTTAARLNVWAGEGAITLGSNPFVSAGTGNFAANNIANGGRLLRNAGYPETIGALGSLTTSSPSVGASYTASLGHVPLYSDLN